nr:hypothetical protein [Nitrospiraceae bacterium]
MTIFAPVNGIPEIFTGTANTELHAYNPAWTEHPSSNCTAICTGTGYGESSCLTNLAIYYYNVTPSNADYQVQADIKCASIPNGTLPYMGGPALRVSSSAYTMYYARWNLNGGAGRWELVRTVNGQDTIIGTYGETISAGTSYTVLISAIGATITLSVNGMQVISVTDSGIASAGYPGMFWRANEISEATNWQAVSPSNLQSAPDAASISDGAAVAVSVLGVDLATGTDVATAGQPASESDAAVGNDLQASILTDIQAPDSAQGSDSVSVTMAITAPDSAACADAGATGDAAPAVSDPVQATEAVSVSAGIEAGDLAAGSDPVTFHAPPAVSQARDSSRINPVYLV